jgi:hypothetical protein
LRCIAINYELVDHAGQAREREVKRDGGVRPDHALDRGVRNVALVPQRDVFHGGNDIGAHDASKPGEIFRQHRIALVRHGRRTLLALGEEFLRLQHFRALQVADLDGQPLDG